MRLKGKIYSPVNNSLDIFSTLKRPRMFELFDFANFANSSSFMIFSIFLRRSHSLSVRASKKASIESDLTNLFYFVSYSQAYK